MSDVLNGSALATATSGLNSFGNLIMVTPVNKGIQTQEVATALRPGEGLASYKAPKPNGIPSIFETPTTILFQYEGENTALLESEISNYFVEENYVLNDNISLKPEVVTIHGVVGELNDIPPQFPDAINFIKQKLIVLSPYTPALSITALNAINALVASYQAINSVVNSAQSLFKFFSLSGSTTINGVEAQIQTKQQYFFWQFYYYWINRQMFTVQTPWATFNNMVIKSLRAIQDAETRMITDFEVTFQRFYVTTSVAASFQVQAANTQGQLSAQSAVEDARAFQQLTESTQAFNPTDWA